MDFTEIPRPFLDGDDDLDVGHGMDRRNPLFYSGSNEPHIPTFNGFGNNVTGDFLRPGLNSDGVLNLPRYHPKYTLTGNRHSDDLEFFGSVEEPNRKIKQNGTILHGQEDLNGSLYLMDPPEEMINIQQTGFVGLQEKEFVDNHHRNPHHHHNGEWSTYYNCCYSPSVFICNTVPGFCYPCTPWLKRVACIGFLIALNVFLLLLVLAIGLQLGTDGFSKKGNINDLWVNDTSNLMNSFLCPTNSTNCLARSDATGSNWSSCHRYHNIMMLTITWLIITAFSSSRRT